MNGFLLLVVLVLLFIVQSKLVHWFAFRKLSYTRRFSRLSAFAGETVNMVEVIQNRKILPVPWVKAESRISPNLRFHADTENEISGDRYHKSVFYLKPYHQITRKHTIYLAKRGYYQAGSVSLVAGDLLGMSAPVRQLDTGAAIEVYPQLLDTSELPVPSSRWQGDLIVKRWIMPDPIWISGMRPYAPGDDPGDIHWRATARTGELQVKVHDQTAAPKMMIVINAQMSEHQWGDLMEYEQDVVEHMISITASLCVNALQYGVDAGFAANIPLDKGNEPAILAPSRSGTRDTELLSALAHLSIQHTQTILALLDNLCAYTGMDMLLLSVYNSELLERRMQALRLRGNTVTLQLIDRGQPGEQGGVA
ncbi:MAG: DUF58 domain-containing protein [Eubacteriales bacterium]|nr:DUF58 domain-containing protein [Eubacteriales bacterium]